MLNIGDTFPDFSLKGVVSTDMHNAFIDVTEQTYRHKWQVFFFWPHDFTFVCPTEIAAFGELNNDFTDRDAQLLGISTDSEFVHLAWKQQKTELTQLPFPMLSDKTQSLSQALGILDKTTGTAKRAVFIVDTQGLIRFSMVTDVKVGRNPSEVLRILDALQTDELCPCNWQKGDETLTIST